MLLNLKKSAFILAIILICIGCDQSSKFLAVKYLQSAGRISYLYDTVRLQYTENTGAFLSLGDTFSKSSRFWLFTVVVFMMLVALIIYAYTISFRYRVKITALALIAGGGISNLIDRITNNGAVVDFLNIGIGSLRTGIFNIADFLILVGIALILIFHSHGRQANG
jgi:signal peptidase II